MDNELTRVLCTSHSLKCHGLPLPPGEDDSAMLKTTTLRNKKKNLTEELIVAANV